MNKAISLVVAASALPFRASTVPFAAVGAHWTVIATCSLATCWARGSAQDGRPAPLGDLVPGHCHPAGRDRGTATHGPSPYGRATAVHRNGAGRVGVLAGLVIGIRQPVLAVSVPTMLIGFTRYSQDKTFNVSGRNRGFVLVMAAGSIAGTFIGGRLLGMVPNAVLLPLVAIILLLSPVKVWRHSRRAPRAPESAGWCP